MLLPKHIAKTLLVLLIAICLNSVQAAVLEPTQDRDSIKNLLHWASKRKYNDINGAMTAINSAITIAKESNLTTSLFNIYRTQGYIFEQNSRPRDASSAYRNALLLQNVVNDSAKMDIYMDWAIVNKKLGNFKIAHEYYNYALIIAEQRDDKQIMSYAYNGIATLYSALSEFENAIKYYHKAINIIGNDEHNADLMTPFRNIAIVYMKANNPVLALANAEKSYNIALEWKDSVNLAGSLETLGIIYAQSGQNDLALQKNLEALKIIEEIGDKRIQVDILMQIAETYIQLNQLDRAEFFFNQCLENKSFFEYFNHPNFYYKIGNLYHKQGKNKKAKRAFQRSLSLSEVGSFKDLIHKNNLALAQTYQELGDYKNAYRCLETARHYSDSLFSEENARNITQAQFIFNIEQSEQKYIDLQLKQSRLRFTVVVLSFSIITLFLIYFLWQRGVNNAALRHKNDEIELKNRRLEDSNEILRQFAYASSHDLKEPLRSISSFTHLIKQRYISLLPPEAEEYMNFVTTGVNRMERLLSALLEYSTIIVENNAITQPVAFHVVLDDVTKNLQSQIQEKHASIVYPSNMSSIRVSRLHLTQLFQNLIGNALKFSNKIPEITITGYVENAMYLICIKDNGIGMNPDYGDKVFRLFQRLNKSANYEGTGIGLTICKNIVEKHAGKIWFESQEGVGTRFFISFPLHLVEFSTVITEGEVLSLKETLVMDI